MKDGGCNERAAGRLRNENENSGGFDADGPPPARHVTRGVTRARGARVASRTRRAALIAFASLDRLGRIVLVLSAFAAASCLVSIDERALDANDAGATTPKGDDDDGGASGTSGAAGTSGGAGTSGSSGLDASPGDAGVDAAPFCPNGAMVLGKTTFSVAPGGGSGLACDLNAVLVLDDLVTGLDRVKGNEAMLDGKLVTGCVGVDFGQSVHLTGVRVRGGPVASACGQATPCAATADGCGTGHSVTLFSGPDPTLATLKHANDITPMDTKADYTGAFEPGGRDVQVVVICRAGWGSDRDDMAIDFIAGICQ